MTRQCLQWVQQWIDRVFLRQHYQIDEALSALSLALASARTEDDVVGQALDILARTVAPNWAALFLGGRAGWFRVAGAAKPKRRDIWIEPELVERLERGDVLARHEWGDVSAPAVPTVWSALDAELIVSIRGGDAMIGMLVCGAKNSGRAYTVNDITFLRTAANQIALALTNAAAFRRLEELNDNLEHMVRERSGALHATNGELNRSLGKLREAYDKLEQSQASLLRADRLATLGRLTAGIAHEMNTPLSAVLNALKILADLGQEYADSIGDAAVLPEDHREIAKEILSTATVAGAWAQKAASYISSVKAHGREARPSVPGTIVVSAVIAETRALLSHRLRTSACQIEVDEQAPGVSLTGDSGRLGQILLNLCTNAIDAYEDASVSGGRILVQVIQCEQAVTITVSDFAGGVPAHVLPHIFDELYTTKGPGRGTGLGLWIARTIVEQEFGGTLTVETAVGVGSAFSAAFPSSYARPTRTERQAGTAAHPPPVPVSSIVTLH
jgi:signal transduction histidine kinase